MQSEQTWNYILIWDLYISAFAQTSMEYEPICHYIYIWFWLKLKDLLKSVIELRQLQVLFSAFLKIKLISY